MKNISEKKKIFLISIVNLIVVIGIVISIILINNKNSSDSNNVKTKKSSKTETVTKSSILKKNKYIVTFDTDGGSIVASQTVVKDGVLDKVEIPTKEGYLFEKWTLEDKEFDLNTKITKNITLKAVWKRDSKDLEKVIVSFNSDGGSNVDSMEIEKGKTIGQLKTPTREGYTFINWYLNNKEFDVSSPINSSITLVAKWKKINYGTFNLDTLALAKCTYTELEEKFGPGEWRSTTVAKPYNSVLGRIYYTSTYVRYSNGYYSYFNFYSYEGADYKEDIKTKTPAFLEFIQAKDLFNNYTDELINNDENLKALGATNFEYYPERNFKRFRFSDYSIDISKYPKGDYEYSEKSLVSIDYEG